MMVLELFLGILLGIHSGIPSKAYSWSFPVVISEVPSSFPFGISSEIVLRVPL